jgi:hypothetical protein
MTWTQAKGQCAAMSGKLLAIHSPEEQNFVASLIADKPMPYIGITMNNTLMRLVLITNFKVLKIYVITYHLKNLMITKYLKDFILVLTNLILNLIEDGFGTIKVSFRIAIGGCRTPLYFMVYKLVQL